MTLTLLQPTCRDRFVHSWWAAVWVAAGIGLACLLYGWLPNRGRAVRHALALAALGVLVVLWGPAAVVHLGLLLWSSGWRARRPPAPAEDRGPAEVSL